MALSLLILDQNQTVRNPYFFIMGQNDLNKTSHAAVSLKGQKRGIIFLKIQSFPLRCFRIFCKFVWYSTRLTQICVRCQFLLVPTTFLLTVSSFRKLSYCPSYFLHILAYIHITHSPTGIFSFQACSLSAFFIPRILIMC
jgi:hypothetical protein